MAMGTKIPEMAMETKMVTMGTMNMGTMNMGTRTKVTMRTRTKVTMRTRTKSTQMTMGAMTKNPEMTTTTTAERGGQKGGGGGQERAWGQKCADLILPKSLLMPSVAPRMPFQRIPFVPRAVRSDEPCMP